MENTLQTNVLVDREGLILFKKYKWSFDKSTGYLVRMSKERPRKKVYFHREIMGFPRMEIDHINHNKLDNRKSNLRIVTHQENLLNKSIQKNNKTGFIGVSFDKRKRKFQSRFKGKFLGYFDTALEAYNFRLKTI